MDFPSRPAHEVWTWTNWGNNIRSLKNRLGFSEHLWILGFDIQDNGAIIDPFHKTEVYHPSHRGQVIDIPARHGAVPEIYCLLHQYSLADEVPLSGEWVSLASLDVLRRPELAAPDCEAILRYAKLDFPALPTKGAPFFGARLTFGDFSFTVWPLPRIPIRIILWQGEDEIPSRGTLLFDRTGHYYLGNLLRELAWLTVWRLHNILDSQVKWGVSPDDNLKS